MIEFKQKGNFKNTERFFDKATKAEYLHVLDKYGREGVAALASVTPKDSGLTANSWRYEISSSKGSYTISWFNSNMVDNIPIAILIQYGHGTKNGGYVQGYDYINPVMKPIFDKIAEEAWREVTS